MDPSWEFQAPQFVDFNNLDRVEAENKKADDFFNVDMESGELWTTALSSLDNDGDDDDHQVHQDPTNQQHVLDVTKTTVAAASSSNSSSSSSGCKSVLDLTQVGTVTMVVSINYFLKFSHLIRNKLYSRTVNWLLT